MTFRCKKSTQRIRIHTTENTFVIESAKKSYAIDVSTLLLIVSYEMCAHMCICGLWGGVIQVDGIFECFDDY